MGNTTAWGLQLSELLLILVTTVYTVLTAVLATQAWRQRRDLSRATVTVRLASPDGTSHDVEVVNAGPGAARDVQVELRFLPDEASDPVRIARIVEPVMLAGDVVPTYHDDRAFDLIEVSAVWRDAVGERQPKPYMVDAAAYRQNVIDSKLHTRLDPKDELARDLRRLVPRAKSALDQLDEPRRDGNWASTNLTPWAQTRAHILLWQWQKRLAVARALGRELIRLLANLSPTRRQRGG